jgi:hypothetical protein
MAPPRVGKEIESLILRLREEEKWTMEKIAQHVKMQYRVKNNSALKKSANS